MSTPEGRVPGELQLGAHSPADIERGGTPALASPGVGMAATRVPSGPTLPDADVANLTLAISRIANELFGAEGVSVIPYASVSDASLQQPAGFPPSSPSASQGTGAATSDPAPSQHGHAGAGPQNVVVAPQHPAGSSTFGSATPSVAPLHPAGPSTSGSATPPVASQHLAGPSMSGSANPSVARQHPAGSSTSGSANPFFAPLDFGGLPLDESGPVVANDAFTVPLLNDVPDAGPDERPQPVVSAPVEPASPTFDRSLFEIQPLVDVAVPTSAGGFDAHAIKREFPILQERVHGRPLVWLDNAATTQKPRAVIERLKTFYERENSNIHRAAHALAARATDAYEEARESVRRFVNASSVRDVVFVRGTTEGINLVAQSWGRRNVSAGDEIVITHLEHHANIVPWQMLCVEKGARLRIAPVDDRGQVRLDEYERLLNDRTKIVAITQVSNALGTVTPAAQMIEMAHRRGIRVLLDGAQSVSHMRVDVQALGCDFFVFSGHKVFAPTGIGAVVAPAALLDDMPPWQGGGNMIEDVTFERTVYQSAPARFEAGTGNIADAVGLGAALDWLSRVGIENVERHEHDLMVYGTEKLLTVPGLRLIGTAADKAGVLSFVLAGYDTNAVSTFLDKEGIAVRGGHHCAQPILRRFGLESTVRASLALYNTTEDIDALVAALCRLVGANGQVPPPTSKGDSR